MLGAYEFWLFSKARRRPHEVARSAHRALRAGWVDALSRQPGSEILAVQALRNSLMSATINASTAALALMGSITLIAAANSQVAPLLPAMLSPRVILELLLATSLFSAYVCSAMAMRYYSHAGFVMSLPVGTPIRQERLPMAVDHVARAGILYSWGLRFFLFVAPIVAGLLHDVLMPLAALALILVLRRFDRIPDVALPVGDSAEG